MTERENEHPSYIPPGELINYILANYRTHGQFNQSFNSPMDLFYKLQELRRVQHNIQYIGPTFGSFYYGKL